MQYATELKKQTGLQLDTHYYGQVLELTWTPTPINYATVCGLDRELRRQSGIDRSGTLHIVTVLKDPDLSQALLDIPREDMSAEVHEDVPAGKVFKLEVRFYASGAFERQFVKID